MRVRIAKLGESLAIRIPNSVAKKLDLAEGSCVEVKVSGVNNVGAVAFETSINDLVAGITPRNRHSATRWGARSEAKAGERNVLLRLTSVASFCSGFLEIKVLKFQRATVFVDGT